MKFVLQNSLLSVNMRKEFERFNEKHISNDIAVRTI